MGKALQKVVFHTWAVAIERIKAVLSGADTLEGETLAAAFRSGG